MTEEPEIDSILSPYEQFTHQGKAALAEGELKKALELYQQVT